MYKLFGLLKRREGLSNLRAYIRFCVIQESDYLINKVLDNQTLGLLELDYSNVGGLK